MLIPTRNTRVSVRSLVLSCMMTAILHVPAGLRHRLAGTDGFVCDVVMGYVSHTDPSLRGNAYQLVGNAIQASLELQQYRFGTVSHRDIPLPTDCHDDSPLVFLETLCAILATALLDKTSSAARAACQAVRTCISGLLMSTQPFYGVELANHLLTLATSTNTYWLIKSEICTICTEINYVVVAGLEAHPDCRGDLLSSCAAAVPRHPFGSVPPIQVAFRCPCAGVVEKVT